jgi:hypothetical protein
MKMISEKSHITVATTISFVSGSGNTCRSKLSEKTQVSTIKSKQQIVSTPPRPQRRLNTTDERYKRDFYDTKTVIATKSKSNSSPPAIARHKYTTLIASITINITIQFSGIDSHIHRTLHVPTHFQRELKTDQRGCKIQKEV